MSKKHPEKTKSSLRISKIRISKINEIRFQQTAPITHHTVITPTITKLNGRLDQFGL
jgi:hypothetical protein